MTNQVIVEEVRFQDRKGLWTSVWAVYFQDRLITVEFTRGQTGLTERVEFDDKLEVR